MINLGLHICGKKKNGEWRLRYTSWKDAENSNTLTINQEETAKNWIGNKY